MSTSANEINLTDVNPTARPVIANDTDNHDHNGDVNSHLDHNPDKDSKDRISRIMTPNDYGIQAHNIISKDLLINASIIH